MNWYIQLALLWVVIGTCVAGVAVALGKRLKHMRETHHPAIEERVPFPPLSLNDPVIREHMRMLLDQYGIVGSCDIRDGKVYPARNPGDRDAMAAALMGIYRREMDRFNNQNLALCIPRGDGGFLPLGLDLSYLREIAQLLEDRHGR